MGHYVQVRTMVIAVIRNNSLLCRGICNRSYRFRLFIESGAAMNYWQRWEERLALRAVPRDTRSFQSAGQRSLVDGDDQRH